MKHPGLTAPRFTHPTEYDERVHTFLAAMFGNAPVHRDEGPDLEIDGVMIEVKSCREWKKANPEHCNGASRRRGHFKFNGTEDADYYLFVLVLENGCHDYRLLTHSEVFDKLGAGIGVINWSLIFGRPGSRQAPAIAGIP